MKKYIIFAGVNGAGKTTLFQTNAYLQNMARVNLDEIVRQNGDWKNQSDVMKAGRKAVSLIKKYFEMGISFNQETTLCGKSIIRNIFKAKEYGYVVEVYYVGLDSPALAKVRVAHRVLAGGHGIPDKDIERRYYESLDNLKSILTICDYVKLYDNTNGFHQIATFEHGRCIDINDYVPEWCQTIIQNVDDTIV